MNLNRATEGLRVVEEVCRFVLEDQQLTVKLKTLRGELSRIVPPSLLAHRDSQGDVGREPYTSDEGRRAKVEDVFRANMKRAQEAVRVLEEFAKLLKPVYGQKFKALRFALYTLEKELASRVHKAELLDFNLYVIIDPAVHKEPEKLLRAGVKIVQLRAKQLNREDYLRLARQLGKKAKAKGITFLLNDHWQLIKEAGADGVHLGWEDLKGRSFAGIRKTLGDDKLIGLSAQTLGEVRKADALKPDYIGFGPIFGTPLKAVKPVGLKALAKAVKISRAPIVAIGGICPRTYKQVLAAGCSRFAVIRAAGLFR
ncbi:MAG: thiamine phosphate synthase [Candidatus Margulisbacteria bacterium]|nr:thiamine phosphate synthase [Candidatus Margulisiibacteriota bacterium]